MTSYEAGYLISDFMGAVLGVMLFAFYETEIGLSALFTDAALVIYRPTGACSTQQNHPTQPVLGRGSAPQCVQITAHERDERGVDVQQHQEGCGGHPSALHIAA